IIDTVDSVTGGGDTQNVLQVMDGSGKIVDRLQAQLSAGGSSITAEEAKESEKVLTDKVSSGVIDSFLSLSVDEQGTIHANYTTMSMMDFSMPRRVQEALQSIQTEMKAESLSLTGEEVQTLFTPIQFEQKNVSPSAKSEEELNQARFL